MSSPYYNNKNSTPYTWQGGDTSTFTQQAKNLSDLGDQGLDTSIVDVHVNERTFNITLYIHTIL